MRKNGEIYLYLVIYSYNTFRKMLKKLTTLVVCEERFIAETSTVCFVVHYKMYKVPLYYKMKSTQILKRKMNFCEPKKYSEVRKYS